MLGQTYTNITVVFNTWIKILHSWCLPDVCSHGHPQFPCWIRFTRSSTAASFSLFWGFSFFSFVFRNQKALRLRWGTGDWFHLCIIHFLSMLSYQSCSIWLTTCPCSNTASTTFDTWCSLLCCSPIPHSSLLSFWCKCILVASVQRI